MAKKRIVFGGGPAGGTFQVVAKGVQVYKPDKALKDYTIKARAMRRAVVRTKKDPNVLIQNRYGPPLL